MDTHGQRSYVAVSPVSDWHRQMLKKHVLYITILFQIDNKGSQQTSGLQMGYFCFALRCYSMQAFEVDMMQVWQAADMPFACVAGLQVVAFACRFKEHGLL